MLNYSDFVKNNVKLKILLAIYFEKVYNFFCKQRSFYMKININGDIKEYAASINYDIEGDHKELVRPWEYARRHFDLAFFAKEESKITINKINHVIGEHIIPSDTNPPEITVTIDLKDRLIHVLLGVANIFLPYLFAKLDEQYINDTQAFNEVNQTIQQYQGVAFTNMIDKEFVEPIRGAINVSIPTERHPLETNLS